MQGVIHEAALYGHLHILEWCRARGCEIDAWVSIYATRGGYLPILQWCAEGSCPILYDLCLEVAGGNGEISLWLTNHKQSSLANSDDVNARPVESTKCA